MRYLQFRYKVEIVRIIIVNNWILIVHYQYLMTNLISIGYNFLDIDLGVGIELEVCN